MDSLNGIAFSVTGGSSDFWVDHWRRWEKPNTRKTISKTTATGVMRTLALRYD
jgi:hypothetical protein